MAWGIKYRTTYKRRSNGQTVIDILEKNYSGSVTNLLADNDCLNITLDGDIDNIYQPTRGSGATIKLLVTPLTFPNILFVTDPQKYIVKVYSDYSGGNLIWQGFISTSYYQENYSIGGTQLTPVTLQCNDGMSVLENLPYMESSTGATYTGFVNVATVMSNIFSKLGITFSTIRTSYDLKIADYSYNPFLYLTVNNENFLDEKGIAKSCRWVLDSIFQPLSFSITFRGSTIYMIDPINLHVKGKGFTYGTSPVYGYNETQQDLGGYLDVTGTTLSWFQTGQVLDTIQNYNQLEIKYDPYNVTEKNYDFNGTYVDASGNTKTNAGNTTTYTTITNDGSTYNLYIDVTMKDWTISGIYGFEGIQKIESGSTNTTGTTDYYIKQIPSVTGQYEHTFPFSQVKQDENMKLELSMDVYVNTKHATNIWSKAAGTVVNQVKIPISIRIGDQWYTGGGWSTSFSSAQLLVRTPDTRLWQTYAKEGILFWKRTVPINIDDSVVNDTWTTCKMIISMGQSGAENLVNGSIHIFIPKVMSLSNVKPDAAASTGVIKNILINKISIQPVTAIGQLPISNDGVSTTTTLYPNDFIKKSPLSIELTNSSGTYGSSKGAFSTDQQVVQGINIKGLLRGSDPTFYDCAKLLAQSLISQYSKPRYKITANIDVKNYLLDIEHYLIQDKKRDSSRAFYIANGVYNDPNESLSCDLIELVSTREAIIS